MADIEPLAHKRFVAGEKTMAGSKSDKDKHEALAKPDTPKCGLVMPISAIDGCGAEHWIDVKAVITEAVESISDPKFETRLVSQANNIGVIQKRIVQNLYFDQVVVCDVSCKNPNVMFELGIRLAFDKPTVIVKDDKTDYSFDTGIIEHIEYPRDLRFNKVVSFKDQLASKVLGTYQASRTDPHYSPFLKNFGTFQVAHLSEEVISTDKLIIQMLTDIQSQLARTPSPELVRLPPADANLQVFRAARHYLQGYPNQDIDLLIHNPAFMSYMAELLQPTSLYPDPKDYVTAINAAVKILKKRRAEGKE
jgi:hypothetical protein